eukprot:augustus_masked-scaffold_17-processed-gene-4.35-mRNA-1 protein AED:1.00 eAED:1.00 QI:0/0/0/0/1/1/3/0/376
MAIVDDRYASYVPKLYSQVPYEIKRVPNKPKDKNKRQKTIKKRTMNYEKQANQLPKLGAQRVIFRDWQESLLAYLGKKHLSMYINYHVHPPQLVVKEPKHSEVAKEMIRKAKGSNPFNIAAVQHYTKTSNGTPFDLFKISMKAHVYKIDDDVVACYEDEEHFYDAKLQYASDVSAIKHILTMTMTVELVHCFAMSRANVIKNETDKHQQDRSNEIKNFPTKETLHEVWRCGSHDHKWKACSVQVIRVNKINIIQEEDDEDPCEHNDIEESNLESSFTPSDDEDETTSSHLNFNIPKMKIIIQKNTIENQTCNYTFKNQCIKALLDSGATRHVTGDKHLLRNTSPETQVSLSGVFEEVKFDTVKGNIHILLLNNTVL